MDLQLKGKVALITGSTKGIGRAIAETLVDEGCHVGICSRDAAVVEQAVSELSRNGVKVVGESFAITDVAAHSRWIERCARELGGIDIFIPCVSAGGFERSEQAWHTNFETDLLAIWRGINEVLPYLEKSSAAAIVAISSTAAIEGFAGATPYAAMKAALLNYAGNLALELAPKKIRVNTVCPGPIFINGGDWDFIQKTMPDIYNGVLAKIPHGRLGSAAEVAAQVALLASPRAGFTTGTNVVIDGGMTQRIQF